LLSFFGQRSVVLAKKRPFDRKFLFFLPRPFHFSLCLLAVLIAGVCFNLGACAFACFSPFSSPQAPFLRVFFSPIFRYLFSFVSSLSLLVVALVCETLPAPFSGSASLPCLSAQIQSRRPRSSRPSPSRFFCFLGSRTENAGFRFRFFLPLHAFRSSYSPCRPRIFPIAGYGFSNQETAAFPAFFLTLGFFLFAACVIRPMARHVNKTFLRFFRLSENKVCLFATPLSFEEFFCGTLFVYRPTVVLGIARMAGLSVSVVT